MHTTGNVILLYFLKDFEKPVFIPIPIYSIKYNCDKTFKIYGWNVKTKGMNIFTL